MLLEESLELCGSDSFIVALHPNRNLVTLLNIKSHNTEDTLGIHGFSTVGNGDARFIFLRFGNQPASRAGVHAFGVGYGEREYLRYDVAPYTSGRHARRRPFRTSYGLMLEKTKNRNLSIPVVCAPAGIRTLDTLIKSQLL